MADDSTTRAVKALFESVERKESAKIYQLALWSDPQRGVPNEVARSALFAAVQPNKARYLEQEVLFSQDGFTITYTGRQLTQSDLDVFEGIMHIARGTGEGNKIRFRARELLRLIDRDTGKSQYQWLLNVMGRLTATCVAIHREGGDVFWGSLLPEGAAKLEDGSFTVEINRQLIKLFKRGYTVIEWEQRRALGKKPLAQHLHAWICSHERPYPVTVEYLRKLTGSDTKDLKHFRSSLKAALDAVQNAGAVSEWFIDTTDKVHITKSM
jgi:hypothetical protein